MMLSKQWLLFSLLAVVFPGHAVAASAPRSGDDSLAIRRVMVAQQQAWNRGDIEAFMHGYMDSPETTFVGTGVRKGYRTILASYREHYANRAQMGRLTFSELDVRLLPGAHGEVRYAVVTGRFHLQRNEHGTASADDGVFSLLWQKTPDGWKIILDHSS